MVGWIRFEATHPTKHGPEVQVSRAEMTDKGFRKWSNEKIIPANISKGSVLLYGSIEGFEQ